jgi:hypothetical protein
MSILRPQTDLDALDKISPLHRRLRPPETPYLDVRGIGSKPLLAFNVIGEERIAKAFCIVGLTARHAERSMVDSTFGDMRQTN